MLDADGVSVGGSDVPRLVCLAHHLRDLSVRRTDHIMGADSRIAVLKPVDRAGIRTLDRMDRHMRDSHSPTSRVVTTRRRIPKRRTVVRRQD